MNQQFRDQTVCVVLLQNKLPNKASALNNAKGIFWESTLWDLNLNSATSYPNDHVQVM